MLAELASGSFHSKRSPVAPKWRSTHLTTWKRCHRRCTSLATLSWYCPEASSLTVVSSSCVVAFCMASVAEHLWPFCRLFFLAPKGPLPSSARYVLVCSIPFLRKMSTSLLAPPLSFLPEMPFVQSWPNLHVTFHELMTVFRDKPTRFQIILSWWPAAQCAAKWSPLPTLIICKQTFWKRTSHCDSFRTFSSAVST